jgi:predicted phosphoadenosine phosphosulfate sulfurtransferase
VSKRVKLGVTVFDAALQRYIELYEAGHRVVVSVSGGKDSTVAIEMAVLAATMTGRLPAEAVTRDEEVMFPGTYEYLDRMYQRDDISLTWLVARQPIINIFNRQQPYWWVFDPDLRPDQWLREPPAYSTYTTDLDIQSMVTEERYPVDRDAGQKLISVVGLRVQESMGRLYGLHSAGGHMVKPPSPKFTTAWGCRPIYDWTDSDVWFAINENHWDYNPAYDVMYRAGLPRHRLRIGPPSMNAAAVDANKIAAAAWPQWWDRVCERLPGMRTSVQFGRRVLQPDRRHGERWEETFWRECVAEAPPWIAERAETYARKILKSHARHSTIPLPEVSPCQQCETENGSWRNLAMNSYCGDPFSMKLHSMPVVEPDFFRPGAGKWGGTPTF